MEITDYASIGISILAVALSSVAIFLAVLNHIQNRRTASATLYLARYQNVELKLADWPKAFKFYGIDIDQAKNHNVTPEMIAYLIVYINAINSKRRADGTNFEAEFSTNSLLRRMFSYDATLTTWDFARKGFGDDVVKGIDLFISSQTLTENSSGPGAARLDVLRPKDEQQIEKTKPGNGC